MKELYKLDKVAYIRFASVYKSFQGCWRLSGRHQGSSEFTLKLILEKFKFNALRTISIGSLKQ